MVADGVTVIVSTAYLDEAERCDRVAVLHQGRAVALDTPDALQDRLRDRVLAVSVDRPREARELLRRHPNVDHAVLFGETLHVTLTGGSDDWPPVQEALAEAGIAVRDAEPVEASLEDVFIHLARAPESGDGETGDAVTDRTNGPAQDGGPGGSRRGEAKRG